MLYNVWQGITTNTFYRNILLFISHELDMKHGRFVPASCLYPPYICMYACLLQCVWPSALSSVCFAYLYIIVITIFYVCSLGYPCTYTMHLCTVSLQCIHGPGVIATHLQWWIRVWRSCIGFCIDISWCVKCSKSHCLGFLTAVLFPVLLDLKSKSAWRSQRSLRIKHTQTLS